MWRNASQSQVLHTIHTFLDDFLLIRDNILCHMQGCSKGQKSGGAGSNAARRRCPAAPSDLPKSGGAAAPLAESLDNNVNAVV